MLGRCGTLSFLSASCLLPERLLGLGRDVGEEEGRATDATAHMIRVPHALLFVAAMLQRAAAAEPTHYEVLNVPADAEAATLRTAYRKAALAWHPDKHPEGPKRLQAQRKFEQANEAFSTLNDPQLRREYDARLANPQGSQSAYGRAPPDDYGRAPPHRSRQTVDVVLRCSLEQLGGWRTVDVAVALASTRPALAVALVQRFGSLLIYLPKGSRHGSTTTFVVGGVLELQLLVSARPHRTFARRGEHLTADRHVPAWHNWRKPPVYMRAVCGTRVRLRQRGEAVPSGGVSCTVAGHGMPLSRSQRGELRVTLRRRSVPGSLVRLGARLGGVALAAAGALRVLQQAAQVFSGASAPPRRPFRGKLFPRMGAGGGVKGRRRLGGGRQRRPTGRPPTLREAGRGV